MSGTAVLLRAFDDTWKHRAESIRAVLCGVTEEEASWQHHSYIHEVTVSGLPPPGTILWHLAHLEHCARHYAAVLGTRPLEEEPETPPPAEGLLRELLASLELARGQLRRQIESLTDRDLNQPCARGMDVCEFVRMVLRHEAWHAGQIAVVRRLYRFRAV
jgi:hypothetical protein